jgi:hypothetical protein
MPTCGSNAFFSSGSSASQASLVLGAGIPSKKSAVTEFSKRLTSKLSYKGVFILEFFCRNSFILPSNSSLLGVVAVVAASY